MLTKEDKCWLCNLAYNIATAIVYALGDAASITSWRHNGKDVFKESLDELQEQ